MRKKMNIDDLNKTKILTLSSIEYKDYVKKNMEALVFTYESEGNELEVCFEGWMIIFEKLLSCSFDQKDAGYIYEVNDDMFLEEKELVEDFFEKSYFYILTDMSRNCYYKVVSQEEVKIVSKVSERSKANGY